MVRKNMLKKLILFLIPQIALANIWTNMWLNNNQQGFTLLNKNKNAQAAEKFTDRSWKGAAYYKNKQYQQAYNEFKHDSSANGLYNQGNALAHMQKYQEALDAYTKALSKQTDFPDAKYNKEIVEKILKQQDSKQQDSKQQDSKQQDSKQQDSKQQDSKQQDSKQQGIKPSNKSPNPEDEEIKAAIAQIPDDPGGLLRNKFLRDYKKQQENKND